jgi:peroxiredoxin
MEMQALQATFPDYRRLGASLVAISPQTAANSRKSARENKLEFPILSDAGNRVANRFGLRFKLPPYLIELYQQLKNDLPGFDGDQSRTLPMPARYVIGKDFRVLYSEVSPDYTGRPKPEDIFPILEHCGLGSSHRRERPCRCSGLLDT